MLTFYVICVQISKWGSGWLKHARALKIKAHNTEWQMKNRTSGKNERGIPLLNDYLPNSSLEKNLKHIGLF